MMSFRAFRLALAAIGLAISLGASACVIHEHAYDRGYGRGHTTYWGWGYDDGDYRDYRGYDDDYYTGYYDNGYRHRDRHRWCHHDDD